MKICAKLFKVHLLNDSYELGKNLLYKTTRAHNSVNSDGRVMVMCAILPLTEVNNYAIILKSTNQRQVIAREIIPFIKQGPITQ